MKKSNKKEVNSKLLNSILYILLLWFIVLVIVPALFAFVPWLFVTIMTIFMVIEIFLFFNDKYKKKFFNYLDTVEINYIKNKNTKEKFSKDIGLPSSKLEHKTNTKNNSSNDFSYSWKSIWDDYESVFDLMEKDK